MGYIYKRNCDICHQSYKGRGERFCSQVCYKKRPYSEETCQKISIATRGVKHGPQSEEHRRKNSEAKQGDKHPFWGKKGILCHNFGRKHTIEQRLKQSLRQQGEKGSNWRGGINPVNELLRKNIEYKLWRESVFKRDNWICQMCGDRGGNLHADHIQPFAVFIELRFDINNGRTLCKECHKKTPTYGRPRKIKKQVLVYEKNSA